MHCGAWRLRVRVLLPGEVDLAGDDEGEQLLARPQGPAGEGDGEGDGESDGGGEAPRLEDGRRGHLAVPGVQEHQQVHHLLLVEEHVPLGHLPVMG